MSDGIETGPVSEQGGDFLSGAVHRVKPTERDGGRSEDERFKRFLKDRKKDADREPEDAWDTGDDGSGPPLIGIQDDVRLSDDALTGAAVEPREDDVAVEPDPDDGAMPGDGYVHIDLIA